MKSFSDIKIMQSKKTGSGRFSFSVMAIAVMGCFVFSRVDAAVDQTSTLENTTIQATKTAHINQEAKRWGLTTVEYEKYLHEMATTPSNFWWKQLDPVQVLGQNAKNETERMKYARLEVQLDHERVSREIGFQHAYSEAFHELYPGAKLIALQPHHTPKPMQILSGDHYFLFTTLQSETGSLLVKQLVFAMQGKSDVSTNVFFVGHATNALMMAYAKDHGLTGDLPAGERLTLNRGGQRKLAAVLGKQSAGRVSLPVLIRVRDGVSKIVSTQAFGLGAGA